MCKIVLCAQIGAFLSGAGEEHVYRQERISDDHREDDSMGAGNLSREILKTQKKELETNVTTQQKKRPKKALGVCIMKYFLPGGSDTRRRECGRQQQWQMPGEQPGTGRKNAEGASKGPQLPGAMSDSARA